MKDKKYDEELTKIILRFQDYLKDNGVDVPFFIAGGAVFSLLNNSSSYSDYDIYFYNEHDFDAAASVIKKQYITSSTDNAVTFIMPPRRIIPNPTISHKAGSITSSSFSSSNVSEDINTDVPFQLIKRMFGKPQDIFKTYDINCSKCAYTSNFELIKSDDWSSEIKINFEYMGVTTLKRYRKYLYKGASDKDEKTILNVYNFIFENKDMIFPKDYNDVKEMTGIDILKKEASTLSNSKIKIAQYLFDWFVSVTPHIELIALMFELKNFQFIKIETSVIEYFVVKYSLCNDGDEKQKYDKYFNRDLYRDKEKEAMTSYPEYFI